MRIRIEKTLEWTDKDTCDTVRLAAKSYGLDVVRVVKTGRARAEATLAGDEEAFDRLHFDINRFGVPEPFLSLRPWSRAEYLIWLRRELARAGVEFTPDPAETKKPAV